MTVQIRDSDGTIRLSGDLLASAGATGDVLTQQANGTYAPAAGGGLTQGTEILNGTGVAINDGATGQLTLDATTGPDALLDITTPDSPLIPTAGVYAITVTVQPTGTLTAAGTYSLGLDILGPVYNVSTLSSSPGGTGLQFLPKVCSTIVVAVGANSDFLISVTNRDGAAQRSFSVVECDVQRIS